MEKNTSQQILDYLSENPNASVRQISRALQVTAADVRYHLSNLLQQNLVKISAIQKGSQRGRPARCYALTHQARPNNTLSLARAALSLLLNGSPNREKETLGQIANHLFPTQPEFPSSLTSKIIHLINRLNSAGYAARWEARPQGPRILFANCPYRELLNQFPELCEVDRLILQKQLSAETTLDQHIHPHQADPLTCQFSVKLNKKP
ncbi:helix-turn-helix transcriptional regulator [Bellilinea sp.]|uniref:helix-turn-helix transcriptional regulator n=1 Tax=Bellilinea sp. TaxID=2838785 RepID=UPI002ADD959A|nr:ArsR family transcriptional regulator [Bellilinea sp.]